MDKNQLSAKNHTPAAAEAMTAIRAALTAEGAREMTRKAAQANWHETLPQVRIAAADLPKWLLTAAQAEGITMQQELCAQLLGLLAKINENALTYDLPLPPLGNELAATRLLQVDDVIKKCRIAAAKLGVEPVHVELKFAQVDARAAKRAQQPKQAIQPAARAA